MTKPNKLRDAMLSVQGSAPFQPVATIPTPQAVPTKQRPVSTRIGKRAVTGFVSQEAYRQLHLMALDADCSIQDLVIEAFNDLFRKHNKSAIA